MKHTFAFILASFITLLCKAQMVYDLNQYKYRVNRYRYQTYTFGSDNWGNLSHTNGWSSHGYYPPWQETSSGTTNYLNVGYSYYKFVNTENLQQVINSYYFMDARHTSSVFYDDGKKKQYSRNSSASLNPNISFLQRKYKGKNFTMVNIISSIYFSGAEEKHSFAPKRSGFGLGSNPSLTLQYGFGKGRLEMISDAAFANFWLDDMQKKGVISSYNAESIFKLAKMVTKVRNTRIIDYRFRAIDQVKMYDSFFLASGMILKPDVIYYSTLYDNYLYANNMPRYSGKRTTWYANGNANSSLNKNSEVNGLQSSRQTYRNYYMSYGAGFLREKEKAMNLHWQRSRSTNILLGYYNSFYNNNYGSVDTTATYSSSSKGQGNGYDIYLARTVGVGYYFNTRSYLLSSVTYALDVHKEKDAKIGKNQTTISAPSISAGLQYYYWFSPNLQLSMSANLNFVGQIDYYKSFFNGQKLEAFYANQSIQPYMHIGLNYVIY